VRERAGAPEKESSRRLSPNAGTRELSALTTHTDTDTDSVVGRKATLVLFSRTVVRQFIPPTTGVKPRAKPPAVLVKVATGSSYADTVRAVRRNSELNSSRSESSGYRHAQNQQGAGSVLAAQKLSSAIVAA